MRLGTIPPAHRTAVEVATLAAELRRTDMLRSLDEAALLDVARAVTVETHAAGAAIVKQGDVGTCMYVLAAGQVLIMARDKVARGGEVEAAFETPERLLREAQVRCLGHSAWRPLCCACCACEVLMRGFLTMLVPCPCLSGAVLSRMVKSSALAKQVCVHAMRLSAQAAVNPAAHPVRTAMQAAADEAEEQPPEDAFDAEDAAQGASALKLLALMRPGTGSRHVPTTPGIASNDSEGGVVLRSKSCRPSVSTVGAAVRAQRSKSCAARSPGAVAVAAPSLLCQLPVSATIEAPRAPCGDSYGAVAAGSDDAASSSEGDPSTAQRRPSGVLRLDSRRQLGHVGSQKVARGFAAAGARSLRASGSVCRRSMRRLTSVKPGCGKLGYRHCLGGGESEGWRRVPLSTAAFRRKRSWDLVRACANCTAARMPY